MEQYLLIGTPVSYMTQNVGVLNKPLTWAGKPAPECFPDYRNSLLVVGFELIFRKLACSSTKMCIREQQLFTVFELKNLTQEITFA